MDGMKTPTLEYETTYGKLTVSVPDNIDQEMQVVLLCWGALTQLPRGVCAKRVVAYLAERLKDSEDQGPLILSKGSL